MLRQRRWLKEVKQADYNASLKYMQVVMEKAEGTKFYEKIKDKFLYIKLEQKDDRMNQKLRQCLGYLIRKDSLV